MFIDGVRLEETPENMARFELVQKKLRADLVRFSEIVSKLSKKDRDVCIRLLRFAGQGYKLLADEKDRLPALVNAVITAEAKRKAARRIANDKDGKQAAKAEAFVLWQAWQRGDALHKSGAAFARDIVDKLPIENEKTVQRWMKVWADQAKNRD